MSSAAQTTPDTPVTVKVNVDGVARRFKLPLRDVGINVLESKVSTATAGLRPSMQCKCMPFRTTLTATS